MAIRQVMSGGVKIEYDDVGKGEPALLCLHGWCGDRNTFEPFLACAGERRRVLAVDWRGHGRSGVPERDFALADVTADMRAVVAESGAARVVPVAVSHGGWIARDLFRQAPDLVAKIVLINWLVFEPPDYFADGLRAMQSPDSWLEARRSLDAGWLANAPRAVAEREMRARSRHGFEMYARAAREIAAAYQREGNPLQAFARLDPPASVLLLHGALGASVYADELAAYAQAHSWFASQQLAAGCHMPTTDAPEYIAKIIEAFVSCDACVPARKSLKA